MGARLLVCSLTSRLLAYGPSLLLQERLAQLRRAGAVGDLLLVVQHAPVFTTGKRGGDGDFRTSPAALAALGFEVHRAPRGGETTFHGPGQLVAYPIVGVRGLGLGGARAFVEALEDAMVAAAGCFGVQARGRVPGKTGVWAGDRKVGAVGVRISHGVSSHGLALNVCTDLGCYKHIVPCGTPDKGVTSLAAELARGGGGGWGGWGGWGGGACSAKGGAAGGAGQGGGGGGGSGGCGTLQPAQSLHGLLQQQQQQEEHHHQQHQQQKQTQHEAPLMAAAEACLVDSLARALRFGGGVVPVRLSQLLAAAAAGGVERGQGGDEEDAQLAALVQQLAG